MNDWTLLKDKLPETGGTFLFFNKTLGCYAMYFYGDEQNWSAFYEDFENKNDDIYWIKIPIPDSFSRPEFKE